MLNNCLKSLHRWLLPTACLLCGSRTIEDSGLCVGCERSLPYHTEGCPTCAAPGTSIQSCGQCQRRRPHFHRTFALLRYQSPVDRLVVNLKYHGHLHLARHLGELMAARLPQTLPRPDCLLPVPLHPSRLRTRGYNQALEIARPVARRLNIPLEADAVRRIRKTPAQTQLPLARRAANVRGAFVAPDRFDGLRVVIVDDVMTSGHTADSLARCLRSAGAERVDVWVVARA